MDHSLKKLNDLQKMMTPAMTDGSPLRASLEPVEKVCDEHGPYISNGTRFFGKREIWTNCPDCMERLKADERQAEADKKAESAKRLLEAQIQDAAIPPRFVGRTFDNFKTENESQIAALNIAQEYAKSFNSHFKKGTGLILSGQPGTGKSHLAGAILQEIMPEHCGLYTTCMSIIRMVRETWRKDSERSEADVLRVFGDVPLLVIDEIGVQYGTDGEQTILFDVLDKRYRDMMPTILLTNQNKEGLKKFIGERSFDRLVESCRWVSFTWDSYRPTARKEGTQ